MSFEVKNKGECQLLSLYTLTLYFLYLGWESNPHVLRHTPLKRARLPIPPPRFVGCKYNSMFFKYRAIENKK